METYEDLQYRIFGYYDAHLSKGSWKDTILSTAKDLEDAHFLSDKVVGMIKDNKLYTFQGVRKHPNSILRHRSLHI